MKYLVIFFSLFCNSLYGNAQNKIPVDTNNITIIPVDTTDKWQPRFKISKTAELTIEDFREVEILLTKCLKTNDRNLDLEKYKRQYVVYINLKGEKEVYVNCFCSGNNNEFSYWKKHLVEVLDGGECFFNVTVNLTTHKYGFLYINGYAFNFFHRHDLTGIYFTTVKERRGEESVANSILVRRILRSPLKPKTS
jgi:hypothetical protein